MMQSVFMEHFSRDLGRLVDILIYFVSKPVRRGSMWATYPFQTFAHSCAGQSVEGQRKKGREKENKK
jgi:hypothetical protein